MDIRHLRQRLGERWRADPKKVAEEEGRLSDLRLSDPTHYDIYGHLWGSQWYRGGPISQRDLAEQIGVSLKSVARWENGEVRPGRMARKALEALGEAVEGRA